MVEDSDDSSIESLFNALKDVEKWEEEEESEEEEEEMWEDEDEEMWEDEEDDDDDWENYIERY